MAFLDDVDRTVVLRLVYAGPPMSGKTATLHALSRALLGARSTDAVYTPREVDGRTLFFDWLEYSAGLFQGRRIRCQIVSVPGQGVLAARRRALLAAADAVVFVADAHPEQADAVRRCFEELRQWLQRPSDEPPVGIIVQANKIDREGAMPVTGLRELLGDAASMAIVPTIATEGAGVREAFVQAVGLALARVRELLECGRLSAGEPDVATGEALLSSLEALEDQTYGHVVETVEAVMPATDPAETQTRASAVQQLQAILVGESPPTAASAVCDEPVPERRPTATSSTDLAAREPRLPNHGVAAGTVWPAVEGRVILHEISRHPRPVVRREPDHCWIAEVADQWTMVSVPQHCFDAESRAREEIVRLARLHAGFRSVLSEHRCITFCDGGSGDWRVWQIVRRERTLADLLEAALELSSPDAVGTELLQISVALCSALEAFRDAGLPCPAGLRDIGIVRGRPVFSGFLVAPGPRDTDASTSTPQTVAGVMRAELASAMRVLGGRPDVTPRIVRQCEASRHAAGPSRVAVETMIAMCLQHE